MAAATSIHCNVGGGTTMTDDNDEGSFNHDKESEQVLIFKFLNPNHWFLFSTCHRSKRRTENWSI